MYYTLYIACPHKTLAIITVDLAEIKHTFSVK